MTSLRLPRIRGVCKEPITLVLLVWLTLPIKRADPIEGWTLDVGVQGKEVEIDDLHAPPPPQLSAPEGYFN